MRGVCSMVAWNLWCCGTPRASLGLPGCPPHAARLAVGAVAFVLCSGVTRESEALLDSSWELHRSHNLKMAPPQSINAIGHHLRVLKPFLILNCGSHTNGLEFFISLRLPNSIFCPHNSSVTSQLIAWMLGKKTRFLKVNWEIKGLQRSKEVSMEF